VEALYCGLMNRGRACRALLVILLLFYAALATIVSVILRFGVRPETRQRLVLNYLEDGGHPLAVAVVSGALAPIPPPPSTFNRSFERSWPCMGTFAALQERHVFTQDSWATPPVGWLGRDWMRAQHKLTATSQPDDPRPTAIISGIAKGVPAEYWRRSIPRLVQLAEEVFEDYHIVIYENDSPAESRHALCEELARISPKSTFLFEDLLPSSNRGRTANIARARNVVLDWVQAHTSGFKLLVVTDLDGGGEGGGITNVEEAYTECDYDATVVGKALGRSDEWDAVSFLHEPYWDLWAFRQQEIHPFDHFGPSKGGNSIDDLGGVTAWIKQHPPEQLITVDSAYMMLSIYKLSAIGSCRYSAVEPTKTPHESAFIRLFAMLGDKGADHPPVCEHAPFHDCIRRMNRGRITILPQVYCKGARGWVDNG
jgi:hypothetical protein